MYSHLLHMFVSCDSQESEPKYQAQMFKGLEDRDLDYSIWLFNLQGTQCWIAESLGYQVFAPKVNNYLLYIVRKKYWKLVENIWLALCFPYGIKYSCWEQIIQKFANMMDWQLVNNGISTYNTLLWGGEGRGICYFKKTF